MSFDSALLMGRAGGVSEPPEVGDEQLLGGSGSLQVNQHANLSLISEEEELRLLGFPPSREDLSTAIPLTVIFSLLLVTGCIGNMCTAIVIARPKNKYMHTATNYYLFSLAMSDFLFLILGLPQELYSIWQRYPYAFGETFCIMRSYLSEASTYASILTISAFTVERYVAICHPLWAHTMSQLPRAVTSIVIIWILAAICAIPPAAELGIVTQRGPISNRTLEQSAQCNTKRTIYENMFAVSAIVFFIVPMIIVTVLYILIAVELRRSSRMNSAISGAGRLSNSYTRPSISVAQLGGHQPTAGAWTKCCHHQRRQLNSTGHPEQVPLSPSPSVDLTARASQLSANLMARIMSHRPSSAIGNEHPAPPNNNTNTSTSTTATTCQCQCRLLTAASSTGTTQRPLETSQSHQYPLQPPASDSSRPPPAGMPRRLHTPLCYHESLLQSSAPTTTTTTTAPAVDSETCSTSTSRQQQPQMKRNAHNNYYNNHYQRQHHQFPVSQQHPHHQAPLAHAGSGHRRLTTASSKKSVIRMLVAVVVSFFICWLPFHAQRLLASYLTKDEQQHNQILFDVYLKLTYISGIMYYLSSTINPLLYQLMSAKFRLAFKETFNCSLVKCSFFTKRNTGCSPSNSMNNNNNKQLRGTHYSPNCRYNFHDCHMRQSCDTNKQLQCCPPRRPAEVATNCHTAGPTPYSPSTNRKFNSTTYFSSLKELLSSSVRKLFPHNQGTTCCSGNKKSIDTTCCHVTLCEEAQLKQDTNKLRSSGGDKLNVDELAPDCVSSPLLSSSQVHATPEDCSKNHHTVFKFITRTTSPQQPDIQSHPVNSLERLITPTTPHTNQTTDLDSIVDETTVIARSDHSSTSSPQQPTEGLLTDTQSLEKKNSLSTTNSVIDECSTSCTTAYSHLNGSASSNQLQHPQYEDISSTRPIQSVHKIVTGSLLSGQTNPPLDVK